MSDTQQAQRDIWIEQQITAMRFDGITTDAAILRAYLMAAYEKGQAHAALAAQPTVVFDQVTFIVKGGYLPADLFVENANEGDRIRIVGYKALGAGEQELK